MPAAPGKNTGTAKNENVGELLPVFNVAIDHQGDLGIYFDISNALELARRGTFGLFVDGRVEMASVKDETDGNHMGLAGPVGGREMGDAGGANKA